MKRLKELGVDTSTASFYWVFPTEPKYIPELMLVGKYGNLKSFEDAGLGIGGFDLQDTLAALPHRLKKKYMLLFYKVDDMWLVEYSYSHDENTLHTVTDESPLLAAYNMLLWYLGDYEKNARP